MELTFRNAKLARLCSSGDRMIRELGAPMARRLGARLQELEAADTLVDMRLLPQARAHELRGDRDEQISLDLVHPMRLILEVANAPIPRTPEGGLDWADISSVMVVEITDTHE